MRRPLFRYAFGAVRDMLSLMRRSTLAIVSMTALTFAVSLVPQSSSATQVLVLDLDSMVAQSRVVVWGTVTQTRAERVPESPGRIHTLVTIGVKEMLRCDAAGAPGKQIEIAVPGGRIGRLGQLVPGAPKFDVGQEVVLLLERQPKSGRLIPVGLSQGRYVVERRPGGAVATAVSDRHGLGLLARGADGRLQPAPASAHLDRQPLSTLLSRIRALAAHKP